MYFSPRPSCVPSLSPTFVLLQYGGAVFSEMDPEEGLGRWRDGEWREGQVAGRRRSVAGLVKLIDEKGKLVFLAG